MKLACIPVSCAQTLDEFWYDHHHPCFLYNDRVFICFGGRDATAYGTHYVVKELGKGELPRIFPGATIVTPADFRILEEIRP